MKARILITLVAAIGALTLAGNAGAHVTVHPNALPAGGFTVVDFRVPNERDKASTVKVDVKFPAGVYFLSTGVVPGWKAKVTYRKLAKPVMLFGSEITREVDRLVWSGGRIRPGQFAEFPVSLRVPTRTRGTLVTFKALQSYSNGEIVRWIGAPSADEPAPQVAVMGANDPVQDFSEASTAAKRAKQTTSSVQPAHVAGAAGIALPLLGLGALGLARLRRKNT